MASRTDRPLSSLCLKIEAGMSNSSPVVRWLDGALVYDARFEGQAVDRREAHPTSEAWKRFWERAEARAMHSSGTNSCPLDGDMSWDEQLGPLVTSVGELLGHPVWPDDADDDGAEDWGGT